MIKASKVHERRQWFAEWNWWTPWRVTFHEMDAFGIFTGRSFRRWSIVLLRLLRARRLPRAVARRAGR